jgi:molybdenum-dependent DNA-binding transcriptional regulator ModE
MDAVDSLMREKNVQMFLLVSEEKTLKAAAKKAGIAYSHARRLVKCWERAELIVRSPSLHGSKLAFTQTGLALFIAAQDFVTALQTVARKNEVKR